MQQVSEHAWTLAPRGSYPAVFAMAETLALRRLPIYVADFSAGSPPRNDRSIPYDVAGRVLDEAEMFRFFPYADVLNWGQLAVAIDVTQLGELGAILKRKQPQLQEMLAYASDKSGMFSTGFLAKYMAGWMSDHLPDHLPDYG